MTFLRIAARNLRRHRARTALASAAVAVSIWVMITVHAYMDGAHAIILHDLVYGQTGWLQVHKKGYHDNLETKPLRFTFEDTAAFRERVKGVAGVKDLMPRLAFFGALTVPRQGADPLQAALMLEGVDLESSRRVMPLPEQGIQHGRMFASNDADEIVMHHSIGKDFLLTYPPPANQPEELKPALLAVDADGTLRGRLIQPVGEYLDDFGGDQPFGVMSLTAAQKLTGLEGRVTSYVLDLDDPTAIDVVQKRLEKELGEIYEVKRWDDVVPFLRENFHMEDVGFQIGVLIFFVVAALGSVNTMMMTVMERTREIGTMMALGLDGRRLIGLFVIEGSLIGMLGAFVGCLVGGATVAYFHFHGIGIPGNGSGLPLIERPDLAPEYIVKCFVLGWIGLMGASLWPAWRAARMAPVEALQTP